MLTKINRVPLSISNGEQTQPPTQTPSFAPPPLLRPLPGAATQAMRVFPFVFPPHHGRRGSFATEEEEGGGANRLLCPPRYGRPLSAAAAAAFEGTSWALRRTEAGRTREDGGKGRAGGAAGGAHLHARTATVTVSSGLVGDRGGEVSFSPTRDPSRSPSLAF